MRTSDMAKDTLRRMLQRTRYDKAKRYLEENGVLGVLKQGASEEFSPNFEDLFYLYRCVRKKRPQTIVEFGVGHSTLTMAYALQQNYIDMQGQGQVQGKLYSVDGSERWIENTKSKLTNELSAFVEMTYSEPEVTIRNGELCHMFKTLPNVRPSIIYVDGPDPTSVGGSFQGLGFTLGNGRTRAAMSADVLMYESTLRTGASIILDGRKENTRFLRRNLKRRYRFKANLADRRHTFVLLD